MRLSHRAKRAQRALPLTATIATPAALAMALLLSACGGADAPQPTQAPATADGDRAKAAAVHPSAKYPDHYEFEAALAAPFAGADARGARTFAVHFTYPGAPSGQTFAYKVELVAPDGQRVVETWQGEVRYEGRPLTVALPWAGRQGAHANLGDGLYQLRLTASAVDAADAAALKGDVAALLAAGDHQVEQAWDVLLGAAPKPAMPEFRALRVGGQDDGRARIMSAPATNGLPYTVYYANLHSQTNDSDGGGAIGSCTSSQAAQSGAYGPAAAFAYAKSAGLDILTTSEHNHYFDGSSSTNTSASASTAKSRYQAGLSAASTFNANNPGFLAVYGMEWGVISNGGHMNIFNSNELYAWEYNGSNELFGDRYVPKSDYAAVYAAMRAQGVVGQFNHPESTGQFAINGTDLAYSADGDEVMVLAEVMGTSAFSANTTETETSHSSYEGVYKKILERGFHVAPATNQDNHCANWGKSYTNRTGILIPTGTALSKSSFVDALKARRVFATMDKNSQIVLTANGHLMGERFSNSGTLNLSVGFANSAGRTAASVQILEGVPGRNGTVSTLASTGTASITPSTGWHFYYAKVTQDDGKVLWSAPVWVNQGSGGDNVQPTATASVSGTGGTITLSATASDNVGVTRVEFLIDGQLKGSDTSSPYSIPFDSTTLTNGSHSLVARAYDAAGNAGSSTAVSFNVSNAGATLNETESNGTIASANIVTTQTTITGTMGTTTDKDFFKVTLAAGKKLRVDMVGPSDKDYDLYIVNGSGTNLVASESPTSSESVTYTNGSSSQTVYIKVISYDGSSTTQKYTLSLSYP